MKRARRRGLLRLPLQRNLQNARRMRQTLRRMPAKARFLSANFLSDESIETQSIDSCPAHRTDAHSTHAIPAEVQPPRIAARVEKSNVLARARINRALPRALAQGTGNASQRQIGQERSAAGVKRNNMVNVESGFLRDTMSVKMAAIDRDSCLHINLNRAS